VNCIDAYASIPPGLSVVVPVNDEAGNIAALVEEIDQALQGKVEFEIVYVDDASADATLQVLTDLARRQPRLRVLRHETNCGQSTAIANGVRNARAPLIATLDGDGQNDPADIPRLWQRWHAERVAGETGPLLLAGWRQQRQDTWLRRLSSRVANGVRAWLLGDATPDTGCGLKMFERDVFLRLPFFDHMHRFMPALVLRQGGRVISVPVSHRPRQRGRSHYGVWNRLWVGIVDIMGVIWLRRRMRLTAVQEMPQPPAPGNAG
jgi:dolichol-phosphate mannosyltransferase